MPRQSLRLALRPAGGSGPRNPETPFNYEHTKYLHRSCSPLANVALRGTSRGVSGQPKRTEIPTGVTRESLPQRILRRYAATSTAAACRAAPVFGGGTLRPPVTSRKHDEDANPGGLSCETALLCTWKWWPRGLSPTVRHHQAYAVVLVCHYMATTPPRSASHALLTPLAEQS